MVEYRGTVHTQLSSEHVPTGSSWHALVGDVVPAPRALLHHEDVGVEAEHDAGNLVGTDRPHPDHVVEFRGTDIPAVHTKPSSEHVPTGSSWHALVVEVVPAPRALPHHKEVGVKAEHDAGKLVGIDRPHPDHVFEFRGTVHTQLSSEHVPTGSSWQALVVDVVPAPRALLHHEDVGVIAEHDAGKLVGIDRVHPDYVVEFLGSLRNCKKRVSGSRAGRKP